jgi:hypothetical protein
MLSILNIGIVLFGLWNGAAWWMNGISLIAAAVSAAYVTFVPPPE